MPHSSSDEAKFRRLEAAGQVFRVHLHICLPAYPGFAIAWIYQLHILYHLHFSRSPDWSVQATVSWVLSEAFGSDNVSIVAEEDVQVLSKSNATGLLEAVVKTVNTCLAETPRLYIQIIYPKA